MLPFTCIDSVMLTDEVAVYYSVQRQDVYGNIEREWIYDRIERGSFHQTQPRQYETGSINTWADVLQGITEEDLRINGNGDLYSPSEILVTIRNKAFIETVGPRKGLRTTYEVRTSSPVEGPFGEVLHFKVQLVRSSDQEVVLSEDKP